MVQQANDRPQLVWIYTWYFTRVFSHQYCMVNLHRLKQSYVELNAMLVWLCPTLILSKNDKLKGCALPYKYNAFKEPYLYFIVMFCLFRSSRVFCVRTTCHNWVHSYPNQSGNLSQCLPSFKKPEKVRHAQPYSKDILWTHISLYNSAHPSAIIILGYGWGSDKVRQLYHVRV